MENGSRNVKKVLEEKKNNEKELQMHQINNKTFNSLNKPFKFNIYKTGKRLSRQLAKLKNNFSNFIYNLSLDSPNKNFINNSKTNINNKSSSKNNLEIKITSPNTSTTFTHEKKHKTKLVITKIIFQLKII